MTPMNLMCDSAGQILRGERKAAREFTVSLSPAATGPQSGFALCVKTDDAELLIPCKLYRATFSSRGYVGITDEAGEAAVYPSEFFFRLLLPNEVAETVTHLQQAA